MRIDVMRSCPKLKSRFLSDLVEKFQRETVRYLNETTPQLLNIVYLLYVISSKQYNLKLLIDRESYYPVLTLISCVMKNFTRCRKTLLVVCYLLKIVTKFLGWSENLDLEKIRNSLGSHISTLCEFSKEKSIFMDDIVLWSTFSETISRLTNKETLFYRFYIHSLDQGNQYLQTISDRKEVNMVMQLLLNTLDQISSTVEKKENADLWKSMNGFDRIETLIMNTAKLDCTTLEYIQSIPNNFRGKCENNGRTTSLDVWVICNHDLKHIFDTLTTMCLDSMESHAVTKQSIMNIIISILSNETDEEFIRIVGSYPEFQIFTMMLICKLIEYGSLDLDVHSIVEAKHYFIPNTPDLDKASAYLKYIFWTRTFQAIKICVLSLLGEKELDMLANFLHSECKMQALYASITICGLFDLEAELLFSCLSAYGFNRIISNIQKCDKLTSEKDQVYSLIREHQMLLLLKILSFDQTIEKEDTVEMLFSVTSEPYIASLFIPLLLNQISGFSVSTRDYSNIYRQYVKLFEKDYVYSDVQILIMVIEGMIYLLSHSESSTELHARQNLFKECNVFETIESLISHKRTLSVLRDTSVHALRLLTSLTKNNNESKTYMHHIFTGDKYLQLISSMCIFKKGREAISEFLRMAVEDNYPIGYTHELYFTSITLNNASILERVKITVSNPYILILLIKSIKSFDDDDQVTILRLLNELAKDSSVNVSNMCRTGILGECIETALLFEVNSLQCSLLFEFIRILGTYSISVKEMSKLFSLFNSLEPSNRLVWANKLLFSLEQMIEKGTGPRYYFNFDGINSALKLPDIDRFPMDGRYMSLLTTINIESYEHPETGKPLSMRIFSFKTKDGYGYELFFRKDVIIFQITHNDGIEIKRIPLDIKEKQWYSFGFSVGVMKKLLGKGSELKIIIKPEIGNYVKIKQSIGKWIRVDHLTECYIGCTSPSLPSFQESHFYGNMGKIVLFNGDLDIERARDYIARGYVLLDEVARLSNESIFEPVMSYSPMTLLTNPNESVCSDVTVYCKDAYIVGRLGVVHRSHAKDVITFMSGGIFNIFPLLLMLDNSTTKVKKARKALSQKILNRIMYIINCTLVNSKSEQLLVAESHGFSIFAYLLLRSSPKHLSITFLKQVMKTVEDRVLAQTAKDIISNLLLDMNLWIYTSYKIQKCLLSRVIPKVISSDRFYQIYNVKKLLDTIRTYYWTQKGYDVLGSEPFKDAVSGAIIVDRPPPTQLAYLRSLLWTLVEKLVDKEISVEDTQALLFFFVDCKDSNLFVELYILLKKIILELPSKRQFLENILKIGYHVILHPLSNENIDIISCTISFICILQNENSKLKFTSLLLHDYLKPSAEDDRTYIPILNACMGNYHELKERGKLAFVEQSRIVNSNIIPVILWRAKNYHITTRIQILTDFKILMDMSKDNIKALCEVPHWETMILDLLPYCEDESEEYKTCFKKAKEVIESIFKTVTLYLFQEKVKSDFPYILLWCYGYYCSRYKASLDSLFISLYNTIFTSIYEECYQYDTDSIESPFIQCLLKKDSPLFSNIVNIIFLIFDFITHTTRFMGEAFMTTVTTTKRGLCEKVINVINFLERQVHFPSNVESLPFTISSYKKRRFRDEQGTSYVIWLCLLRLYSDKNIESLKSSLKYVEDRLFSKNVTKVEVYYVTFHFINALLLSSVLITYEATNEDEKEWIIIQTRYIVPMTGKIFNQFKSYFSELKSLDSDHQEYLRKMEGGVTLESLIFHTRTLELAAFALKNVLKDVLHKDVTLLEKFIEKNSQDYALKYQSYLSNERGDIIDKVNALLPAFQKSKVISKSIMKDYYIKVERQWLSVYKNLRTERGPWNCNSETVYWKLSRVENFSRMRQSLIRDRGDRGEIYVEKSRRHELPKTEKLDVNDINLLPPGVIADNIDTNNQKLDADEEALHDNAESDEKIRHIKLKVPCEWIKITKVIKGVLKIANNKIVFKETLEDDEEGYVKEKVWNIMTIRELHYRRYLLMKTALEIFFTDQTTHFFNFQSGDVKRVYSTIRRIKPPTLLPNLKVEECTAMWQKRALSNFDYLMMLNTLSGRTYNDLSQYPVFPWIIVDMDSKELDLSNPSVYRDLSKPVGALNEKRLDQFIERFECMPQNNLSFLYGTHYSCAAYVLYYLVRIEPFTKLSIKLNDNSFDHPDRMFFSIPHTLQSCLNNTSDVRELIPEFFYFPEMLENVNGLNYGVRQTGESIDSVKLPAWAKTPYEFIEKHREALESDFVSDNLHHWIDLIFGYKQRGDEAINANNLFHYMSYEGVVNIEKITDPVKRRAAVMMITEFGQTPSQLFSAPHVPRGYKTIPKFLNCSLVNIIKISNYKLVYLSSRRRNIIAIDNAGMINHYNKTDITSLSNLLTETKIKDHVVSKNSMRLILMHLNIGQNSIFPSKDGRVLFIPRQESNGLKVINVETKKILQVIPCHIDLVTAVTITEDGSTLITGSVDTQILTWKIELRYGNLAVSPNSTLTLYGHSEAINMIVASIEFQLCVSVSMANTCIIHNLRDGSYIRTIHPEQSYKDSKVDRVFLWNKGFIFLFYKEKSKFLVYSLNGKLLREFTLHEHPEHLELSDDHLVSASEESVYVRELVEFSIVKTVPIGDQVTSLAIDDTYILIGTGSGGLGILLL